MSALALGLCGLERQLFNTLSNESEYLQKASYVARLGSGSACRSVYPHLAVWGQAEDINLSSDHFAIPYDDVHPSFLTFHDDVLIISSDRKSVSSTVGHALMNNNPFAEVRYRSARQNLQDILIALKSGDLEQFGRIVEEEALMLHALMMCSKPSFILMKPNTLQCIEEIKKFRLETNVPLYFTLDAGPNVHVLYPKEYQKEASKFIKENLLPLTESNVIIRDKVGTGPIKLL
jgi:diphosphomevalonate decarboxylase